jgi:uncharacterized membrane protein YkvA (DUF1232 family)
MRPAWKARARALAVEVSALSLACRDPRVPWYAKALAGCVVAYALSPIDLVPDFAPVLGHVDDVIIVPLGVLAVRRMIPAGVLAECRARAATTAPGTRASWAAAAIIVALWVGVGVGVTAWWCGRAAGR